MRVIMAMRFVRRTINCNRIVVLSLMVYYNMSLSYVYSKAEFA